MKRVTSALLIVGMFFLTMAGRASDIPTSKNPEGVQIQKMLTKLDFSSQVAKGTKINISFIVNAKNEIIVLSTNNGDYDDLIKTALNYQKISISELLYNTVYTLPVEFK